MIDRDIDKLMGSRTAARPVASGRVPAPRALEFGLVLSALSFALLASTVNVLTALLALVGNLFYVVVYTGYLKRSTDQNIVIGGAAGAVPPLVGYAAATGSLALPALWLFLIVFLWTPPHFWALALMIKDHYAAANVPMLPGTRGDAETTRQILLYSVVLVAFTLVVGIWLGPLYTVAAAALGAYFLLLAHRLRADASKRNAVVLFHYSLAYLALLFVAAAIDPLVVLAMLSPELSRKNNRLGLALFAVFVALFVGACVIALIYLQVDDVGEPWFPTAPCVARRLAAGTSADGLAPRGSRDAEPDADRCAATRLSSRARGPRRRDQARPTPVTEADREVEHELRAMLGVERRRDAILGEEQGASGSGRRRWIIDPIDGTRNYSRGVPVWATLIALEEDGAGRARRGLGPRAPPPLVGRARRGRPRGRRRRPRLGGAPARGRGAQLRARAAAAEPRRAARGTPAATATSGATCSSPRERSTARSTRSASRSGTSRRCR